MQVLLTYAKLRPKANCMSHFSSSTSMLLTPTSLDIDEEDNGYVIRPMVRTAGSKSVESSVTLNCDTLQSYAAFVKRICDSGTRRQLDRALLNVIWNEKELGFGARHLLNEFVEGSGIEPLCVFPRVCAVLVEIYSWIGKFEEAFEIVLREMYKPLVPLSSCNLLMSKLVEFGKLETALEFYKIFRHIGLTPDPFTHSLAIKAFCGKGSFSMAASLLGEISEDDDSSISFLYTNFIESLCKNNQSDIAWKVLQVSINAKVPIDIFAFFIVIRTFCSEMKLKEAEHAFLTLISNGMQPDVYVFGALICGFAKTGDLHKALSLHDEMLSRGISSNHIVVNSLLQCLCRLKKYDEAVSQFRILQNGGVYLDKANYNVAIDALCKLGKVEEADELLNEMKGKRIHPDVINYNTLILGYVNKGKITEAMRLLTQMKENLLNPNVTTYNFLLSGTSKLGLVNETNALLNEMEFHGINPGSDTNSLVIQGLCSSGNDVEAYRLFRVFGGKTLENYCSMVRGYCKGRRTTMALDLFTKLCVLFTETHKGTCVKLLRCLVNEGDSKAAFFVYKKAVPLGAQFSTLFYTKLVKILCDHREVKKARYVFDEMLSREQYPNLLICTILLNGYCKGGYLGDARALYEDMRRRGIKPDVVTYTVLVDGYLKSNNGGASMDMMREMGECGIEGDVVFYTVLVDRHCRLRNMYDASRLLDRMIKRGVEPDTVAFTALLSGYCQVGDEKGACQVFEKMRQRGMHEDRRARMTFRYGILKVKRHFVK